VTNLGNIQREAAGTCKAALHTLFESAAESLRAARSLCFRGIRRGVVRTAIGSLMELPGAALGATRIEQALSELHN
jgi:hypothetical protein